MLPSDWPIISWELRHPTRLFTNIWCLMIKVDKQYYLIYHIWEIFNSSSLHLQLVGLAYEIHDTYKNKLASEETDEEGRKADLWCRFQGINPSLLDMIFYSYCYVGLLTGKLTIYIWCVDSYLFSVIERSFPMGWYVNEFLDQSIFTTSIFDLIFLE